jgi:hypothetical protein
MLEKRIIHISSAFLFFVITFIFFPISTSAQSLKNYETPSYSSCRLLRQKYLFGIALGQKTAGEYPAKISRKLYLANSELDSDNDGIVCEIETLQSKTSSDRSSGTLTTSPSITIPINSTRINVWINRQISLKFGQIYTFWVCASSGGATYMDIQTRSNGWVQRATSTSHLGTDCTDASAINVMEWTWKVDFDESTSTKLNFRTFRGVGPTGAITVSATITK